MSMIAGGDERARNAFRATLRDEPSSPSLAANATQELDANDILEVRDLARAIERAEQSMKTPLPLSASQRDIFDVLAGAPASSSTASAASRSAGWRDRQNLETESPPPPSSTDDIVGPATFKSPRTTPPPAGPTETLRPAVDAESTRIPRAPAVPTLTLPPIAKAIVAPIPTDEDAYFHPGSKIRGLADESIQIARPEATIILRARGRRKTATWVAGLGLAVLAVIGIAAVASGSGEAPAPAPAKVEAAPAKVEAAPAPAKVEAAPAPAKAEAPVSKSEAQASKASEVPTFDVKSLPAAKK